MLCAEDVCRCFVQKSLQWHEQNQPKTTQSMENTSPFLVPAQFSVPLCFLMPRGARSVLLQDHPRSVGQSELCQSSQDGNRMGYSPCYTITSHGLPEKMQLAFDLRRNQPLSQVLAALGQIQMELEAAEHNSCREFWEPRGTN